jgi:diacylglycerol kinase family enzyme
MARHGNDLSVCVIVNPGSGGGGQEAVRARARGRGWQVREVGAGAGAAELAASANADVLIAAGGDGTVSAVAGGAVDRGLPLVVAPCGTRNHFAADAGFDLADPATNLAAVDAGVEVRVDVGQVNERIFLNNVSVGFYASMVRDPQYRNHRLAITARYLRRALLGDGATLVVATTTGPRVIVPEQLLTVLVSNNAYSPGIAPGPALRPRLDAGVLWVHLLGLNSGRSPVGLRLLAAAARLAVGRGKVAAWPSTSHELDTDRSPVTVAVDGESTVMSSPLVFTCRPGALRLLRPPEPAPGTVRHLTLQD